MTRRAARDRRWRRNRRRHPTTATPPHPQTQTTPEPDTPPTPSDRRYSPAKTPRDQLHHTITTNNNIPCTNQHWRWWTSPNHYHRTAAANLCHTCPAIQLCAQVAETEAAQSGVWAGRDCDQNPYPDRRNPRQTPPQPTP